MSLFPEPVTCGIAISMGFLYVGIAVLAQLNLIFIHCVCLYVCLCVILGMYMLVNWSRASYSYTVAFLVASSKDAMNMSEGQNVDSCFVQLTFCGYC